MLVLQDWITVRAVGATGGSLISQSHSSYLDLAHSDDVVLYLSIQEASFATAVLTYQSAPAADDASFLAITPSIPLTATTTPVVTRILAGYSPVPLARFLRWTLNVAQGDTGDVTFRILAATYAPGP